MSDYENYDRQSSLYKSGRRPVGLAFYLGSLLEAAHQLNISLSDLRVLDAGGGTGNYTLALLKHAVGHVTLFDASEGMLSEANQRLRPYIEDGRCTIMKGVLPTDLSQLQSEDFHVVMFNQVIHHLYHDPPNEWDKLHLTLQHMSRILVPDGILLINYAQPYQQPSFWFNWLLTRVSSTFCKRLPLLEDLKTWLSEAGLHIEVVDIPISELIIPPEIYYHYDVGENFRSLASCFSLATEDELETARVYLEKIESEGRKEEETKKWEDFRVKNGQNTSVLSRKVVSKEICRP